MDDSLAVLLLPGKLEDLALEGHAVDLLSIPRVIALEPSRLRPPRFLRDAISLRQARRLRFPGRLRLLVLYHPAQYPLARALRAYHADPELWYIPPRRETLDTGDETGARELLASDELARERASQVLTANTAGDVDDTLLRARLRELGVINPHAFRPGRHPRQ